VVNNIWFYFSKYTLKLKLFIDAPMKFVNALQENVRQSYFKKWHVYPVPYLEKNHKWCFYHACSRFSLKYPSTITLKNGGKSQQHPTLMSNKVNWIVEFFVLFWTPSSKEIGHPLCPVVGDGTGNSNSEGHTVRPRGTRSMCPQKNRVPRNRLPWGLLLFTRVSKSEKNRVSWG